MINAKYLSVILLLFIFMQNGFTQNKFVIQTDQSQQLRLRDAAKDSTYNIPEYRKSSGGYLLDCDPINFQLLWLGKDISTNPISIKNGEEISLQKCFDEYEKNYFIAQVESIYQKICYFFNTARYGVVTKGENAYLKTSDENATVEFKIFEANFLKPNTFRIDWDNTKPVCKVEIVNKKSGEQIFKQKKPKKKSIDFDQLSSKAQSKLLPGEEYTLRVYTKKGFFKHHENAMNFYILNEEELEIFESFIDSK